MVYQMGDTHLEEVCKHLKIESQEGISSSQLKRKVIRKLSTVEEGDDGEEGLEDYFRGIRDLMLKFLEPVTYEEEEESKQWLGDRGNMGGGENTRGLSNEEKEEKEMQQFRNMFRKDLKFSGKIGEPGQKDSMSYTSLYYQIRSARQQGYPDKEIIIAVIRSISPNLELRAYLEGKRNLTFDTMMKTIRAHYKEKDATTLFTSLSTTRQLDHESAQDFVMRVMTLKQKILFVSQEESCEYSESLVQDRFLHTVLTGLKNSSVRSEMRPLLKDKGISDEELLEGLRFAVADEVEHQNKFNQDSGSRRKATADVHVVSKKQEKKENPILKELGELKSQVLALTLKYEQDQEAEKQKDHNKGRHLGNRNVQNRRDRNRCDMCLQNGTLNCDHCFICFSSEHYSRGCKQRRNLPGKTKK